MLITHFYLHKQIYNITMDVKKEIGTKIKKLRQKTGLTQEEFAEKINIATRTLAGIEIGESFVSAHTIEKIMQYFNITFEDFFITSHLRPKEELMNDIVIYLNKIKDDRNKIETIYKIIKTISNE